MHLGGFNAHWRVCFSISKLFPGTLVLPPPFRFPIAKRDSLFSIVEMKRVLLCASLQSCPFVIVLCSFLGIKKKKKKNRSGTAPKSNHRSSTIGEMVLHPEFGIIWEEKHKGVAECQVCVCVSLSSNGSN
jgi:hypothetical protein